jgi:hypothetical protein
MEASIVGASERVRERVSDVAKDVREILRKLLPLSLRRTQSGSSLNDNFSDQYHI